MKNRLHDLLNAYGRMLILLILAVIIFIYGFIKIRIGYSMPVFSGACDTFTEQLRPGDRAEVGFSAKTDAKISGFCLSFVNFGVTGQEGCLSVTVSSDKTGEVVNKTELPVAAIREWAQEEIRFPEAYRYSAGETLFIAIEPVGFTENNALSIVLADGKNIALRVIWDQWGTFQKLYPAIAALLICLIALVYIGFFRKKWKTEHIWCICMAVLLPVFMLMIPGYGGANGSMTLDTTLLSPMRFIYTAIVLAVMFIAMKRIPFGKEMFFVITLLPSTLQKMTEVSRENAAVVSAFLFLAVTLNLIYGEKDRLRYLDYGLAIAAAVFISISCSGTLFPLCLMLIPVFLKLRESEGKEEKIVAWVSLALVPLCFVISILSMPCGPGELLRNPGSVIRILSDSVYHQGDRFLFSMGGVYLGDQTIVIPQYMVLALLILLLIAMLRVEGEVPALKYSERVMFAVIGILGIIFTMCGSLLGKNLSTEELIDGSLGAAFLPFIPVFLLSLRSNRILLARPGKIRSNVMMAAVFIQTLVITALFVRS